MKIFITEIDISQLKKRFEHIDDNIINQILDADPTQSKKYSQWLLKIYDMGNLREEDIYKAEEYLSIYDKIKNKLPLDKRDINKTKKERVQYVDDYDGKTKNKIDKVPIIPSLQDLFLLIKPYKDQDQHLTKRETTDKRSLVFQGDLFSVYIPKNHEDSCRLGSGTEWCTAHSKVAKHYNDYSKSGTLYILINKNDKSEKYQFHFESGEFMDADDKPISLLDVLKDDQRVFKYFWKKYKDGILHNTSKDSKYIVFKDKKLIIDVNLKFGHIPCFIDVQDGEIISINNFVINHIKNEKDFEYVYEFFKNISGFERYGTPAPFTFLSLFINSLFYQHDLINYIKNKCDIESLSKEFITNNALNPKQLALVGPILKKLPDLLGQKYICFITDQQYRMRSTIYIDKYLTFKIGYFSVSDITSRRFNEDLFHFLNPHKRAIRNMKKEGFVFGKHKMVEYVYNLTKIDGGIWYYSYDQETYTYLDGWKSNFIPDQVKETHEYLQGVFKTN
jgi:hypothetical protein